MLKRTFIGGEQIPDAADFRDELPRPIDQGASPTAPIAWQGYLDGVPQGGPRPLDASNSPAVLGGPSFTDPTWPPPQFETWFPGGEPSGPVAFKTSRDPVRNGVNKRMYMWKRYRQPL